ncbi:MULTISPECIES: hypothetical protein [unclassified Mycolicibacterium]|uniref:hypothetical protein n=1 Tax=unclassified Mycolicibacterium TaxID=2636767 RepID=UPI002ED7FA04
MRMPEALEALSTESEADRVFGEPYQTPDGATIVPVSKVRHRRDGSRVTRALGVFVVKDGRPTWVPAVDATRLALMGELIGLVAATLATAAMIRRPPWPDLRADLSRCA